MRIIPAIDLINGQAVRLRQGDYNEKTVYSSDPLILARAYEEQGFRYLHLVDLDGARTGESVNLKVLEKLSAKTGLEIDFGGGIRDGESLVSALDAGAAKVTIGSMAIHKPELAVRLLEEYGPEKLILGADCRDSKVKCNGWLSDSETDIFDFLAFYLEKGFTSVVCTDIRRDGMMTGPSLGLYQEIIKRFPTVKLIASGGVSTAGDARDLAASGLEGCIIGKALLEGSIDPKELICLQNA